jgi:hypothetical protein
VGDGFIYIGLDTHHSKHEQRQTDIRERMGISCWESSYRQISKPITVTDSEALHGGEMLKAVHCTDSWLIKRMASSGILRRVALVRTDVSEERSASFISVIRISELVTTLAVTSNRRTLRRNTKSS